MEMKIHLTREKEKHLKDLFAVILNLKHNDRVVNASCDYNISCTSNATKQ